MTLRRLSPSFLLLILLLISFSSSGFSKDPLPPPGIAPFMTDKTANIENNSPLMGIYDSEQAEDIVPLDKPHRTTEQMAVWVEDHVTAAMNIDVLAWDAHIAKIRPDFDPYGLQEYQQYLESNGILNLLRTNGLRLNAIPDGNAALLSEGPLSGSYHWLYQIPLLLSYYDRDTKTLKGAKIRPQNQKIAMRVQVGRIPGKTGEDGIVIERWSLGPVLQ